MTVKNSEFVRPVPDHVRDNGSGIQNKFESQDFGYRIGPALNLIGGPAQTPPE
jgi:hypothetical protein